MTVHTSPPRTSLFDRLGGFDKVDQAVARLFERLARDPLLSFLLPGGEDTDVRWQAELLLTDLLGGPMAYDGPEPRAVAGRLGLDQAKASLLLAQVVASFADGGMDAELMGVLQARLEEYVRGAPPAAAEGEGSRGGDLIVRAVQEVTAAGVGDWNLFVLDPTLTVVHVSAEALRAVQACEAELRRAFNLGAAELVGVSILRFHSAPTQLQAALADPARLPHETTWSFGQAVWKARFLAVRAPDGRLLGYAVPWRDESDAHRRQAAFQRLRNQAEDLPVPVMFPDATCETWFGNAACEHALERLAPHLPHPFNSLEGIPISIFFPDPDRRRVLFQDAERLPHKAQVRIGPETVALLVTPVRDQEQRFLGPQITWEIVHFTPRAAGSDPDLQAAHPEEGGDGPSALRPARVSATAQALRGEARALGSAAQELQTLIRLLEAAADEAEGQAHVAVSADSLPLPEAERLVEVATAVLAAAREASPGSGRRESVSRALETITGIAHRTSQLALDAALLAVQDDATQAAEGLRVDSHAFTDGLRAQVHSLNERARASADALRLAMAASARLEQLRGTLAGGGGAG